MYRVSNAQHNKGKTGDVYGLSELILMDLFPCPQIDLLPSSLFWVSDVKDCFLFGSALQDDVVLAVVLPSFSSPKDPSLELVSRRFSSMECCFFGAHVFFLLHTENIENRRG